MFHSLPLALVPSSRSQREAVAWYLREPNPTRWLDEAMVLDCDLEQLLFLPVSGRRATSGSSDMIDVHNHRGLSSNDSSPDDERNVIGVLIVSKDSKQSIQKERPRVVGHFAQDRLQQIDSSSPRSPSCAIPYGCEAGRLFVPVEAAFSVPVDDWDFSRLLVPDDSVYVWHPTAGLIRFERHEQLTVHDLLEPPSNERHVRTTDCAQAPTSMPSIEGTDVESVVLCRRSSTAWDRAVPGMAFPTRLISVIAEEELSIEELMQVASGHIGSERNSLYRLPPSPSEWFGGAWHRMMKPIRSGWHSFTRWMSERWPWRRKPRSQTPHSPASTLPQTAGGGVMPNWLASTLFPIAFLFESVSVLLSFLLSMLPFPRIGFGPGLAHMLAGMGTGGFASGGPLLGDWPAWAVKWFGMLSRMSSSLSAWQARNVPWQKVNQRQRNREIDRLLNMLNQDPDNGLRFALPMGGGGSARGIAPPTNTLMLRSLNFSLGGFFAAGPVDPWMIPVEQQMQLISMYRELAAREIRFGRHHRAAYIFAELLGDLLGAANALEQGHHFREAAALFRDKLKQPLNAAKCLERGGLLDEAAALYIDLGQLEPAAEIYLKLNRIDAARDLFRLRVDELLRQADYRGAAQILEFKLNEVDEALEALAKGWPDSPMAQFCLADQFVILARHERHQNAHAKIVSMKSSTLSNQASRLLARVLSGLAKTYPDAGVRVTALDATQIVVARRLPGATAIEASELLSNIQSLAPQDRLLQRDCDRFVRERAGSSKKTSTPIISRSKAKSLTLVKSFPLSIEKPKSHVGWRVVRGTDTAVYLAGKVEDDLIFRCINWSRVSDGSMVVRWSGIYMDDGIVLEAASHTPNFVALHVIDEKPLVSKFIVLTEPNGFRRRIEVGPPSWSTHSILGMCTSQSGHWYGVSSTLGTFEVQCFNSNGEFQGSNTFFPPVRESAEQFDGNASIRSSNHSVTKPIALCHIPQGPVAAYDRMLFMLYNHQLQWVQIPSSSALELPQDVRSLLSSNVASDGDHAWMVATFDHGAKLIPHAFLDHRSHEIAADLDSVVATFLPRNRLAIAGSLQPRGHSAKTNQVRVYQLDRERATEIARLDIPSPIFGVTRTDVFSHVAAFCDDQTCRILKIE